MYYEMRYAGAYQIEETIERSTYSILCVGKKGDSRQTVLLRHWLTAHVATEEEEQRIQAEVAALRALRHPHLLPVLEVSTNGQGVFLVTANAPGGVLSTRLVQSFPEPFPLDEALQLIKQVGQALSALHQQGIVHGNLTPQAIFLGRPGQVYLGECRLPGILACITDYQPAHDEGTPRCWYMAPEQFSGVCDELTDQYALGCLAYHLLSGRLPFAGSARATLLQKHQQEQPRSLSEHNPAIPAHLEKAVLKALAKQPTERHSSVQAFLSALEEPLREDIADQPTGEQLLLEAVSQADIQEQPTLHYEQKPTFVASTTGRTLPAMSRIHRLTGGRSLSPRGRVVAVLVPAVILVLALVFLTSNWLFSPGTASQHVVRGTTSNASLLTPGSTLTTGADQATANASLSPTPAITLTAATSVPSQKAVTPLLDCVTQTGGAFQAAFGYQNPNPSRVTIPLGSKNVISPSNSDGTQPTSFAPGSYHQVFRVSFTKHGTVTWSLNGLTVTADSNSQHC